MTHNEGNSTTGLTCDETACDWRAVERLDARWRTRTNGLAGLTIRACARHQMKGPALDQLLRGIRLVNRGAPLASVSLMPVP